MQNQLQKLENLMKKNLGKQNLMKKMKKFIKIFDLHQLLLFNMNYLKLLFDSKIKMLVNQKEWINLLMVVVQFCSWFSLIYFYYLF